MSIYTAGSMIAGRFEVVVGPNEHEELLQSLGVRYICLDRSADDRPVMLKTIMPQLQANKTVSERFWIAGNNWVKLGVDAHFVSCREFVQPRGGKENYLLLDFIPAVHGELDASLRAWMGTVRTKSTEQSLLFCLQVALGMKAAHIKIPSLIHGNLKPENILIGFDGAARVTDFGLYKVWQAAIQAIPKNVQLNLSMDTTQGVKATVGTPRYMAKELWEGKMQDIRSDIYAFGCIIYELLTRTFAFDGETIEELEAAHRAGSGVELPGEFGEPLIALVKKCTAPVATDRFSRWDELEIQLRQLYSQSTGKEYTLVTDAISKAHQDRIRIGWAYNSIGNLYTKTHKLEEAFRVFDKMATVGIDEDSYDLIFAGLEQQGHCYRNLGDLHKSILLYEKQGNFARNRGDRRGEGVALTNLGSVHLQAKQREKALEYYEFALSISQDIHDLSLEAIALGGVANTYYGAGELDTAIKYYEMHLAVVRQIGDQSSEGKTLGNLGNAYADKGDTQRAIECYSQHMIIAQSLGEIKDAALTAFNLSLLLYQLHQYGEALEQITFAHDAFTQLGLTNYTEKTNRVIAKIKERMAVPKDSEEK